MTTKAELKIVLEEMSRELDVKRSRLARANMQIVLSTLMRELRGKQGQIVRAYNIENDENHYRAWVDGDDFDLGPIPDAAVANPEELKRAWLSKRTHVGHHEPYSLVFAPEYVEMALSEPA